MRRAASAARRVASAWGQRQGGRPPPPKREAVHEYIEEKAHTGASRDRGGSARRGIDGCELGERLHLGLDDDRSAGTAHIFTGSGPNQLCGTFTWSGIHGSVGFGHIHQAQAGQPENVGFTINLFGPPTSLSGFQSGVTGCTVVPQQVQAQMARFPQLFLVTIHTTAFPAGAIRGQLGSAGPLLCEISQQFCPPLAGT